MKALYRPQLEKGDHHDGQANDERVEAPTPSERDDKSDHGQRHHRYADARDHRQVERRVVIGAAEKLPHEELLRDPRAATHQQGDGKGCDGGQVDAGGDAEIAETEWHIACQQEEGEDSRHHQNRGLLGQEGKARGTGGGVKSQASRLPDVQGEKEKSESKKERHRTVEQELPGDHHRVSGDGYEQHREEAHPPSSHHRSDRSPHRHHADTESHAHKTRSNVIDAGDPIDERNKEMNQEWVGAEDAKQLRVVLVTSEGRRLAGIDGLIGVESESIEVDEPYRSGKHEQDASRREEGRPPS